MLGCKPVLLLACICLIILTKGAAGNSAEEPVAFAVEWQSGRLQGQVEVLSGLHHRALRTKLEMIENEKEETFEHAAQNTRNQPCPTWLGLPRDFRLFEVDKTGWLVKTW